VSGKKQTWQFYWAPTAVILVGLVSLSMVVGLDRLRNHLRDMSTLVDLVLDVQLAAATYHIGIDEVLEGDRQAVDQVILAEIDRTIGSVEASLQGTSHTARISALEPLRDSALQTRLEELQSLLLNLRAKGIGLLMKHQELLLVPQPEQQFHASSKEIYQKAVAMKGLIESRRHEYRKYLQNLLVSLFCAWTFIMATVVTVLWRFEVRRKNAAVLLFEANQQLFAQAEELAGHRKNLTRLVEERTGELTAANARLRVEITERKQTEDALRETEQQIRDLSNRLLQAQEMERRRISMELHDALGQALNVTKLKIRFIEKGLMMEQSVLREDCEQLLGFMDQVIEDVRRISLALSPTILEDLGLTSAIEWLVDNFARMQNLRSTRAIEKIDQLFPEDQWITIYRVVQEALTNIGRHAGASNTSVIVRRYDQEVVFTIEDDGKGFDPELVAMKDVPENGFGLSTMNERVRMMGGALDLRSRMGEGTRITFRISALQEEV
jgi:signal transduction histidine kinase